MRFETRWIIKLFMKVGYKVVPVLNQAPRHEDVWEVEV
jgi:hypothetical protein